MEEPHFLITHLGGSEDGQHVPPRLKAEVPLRLVQKTLRIIVLRLPLGQAVEETVALNHEGQRTGPAHSATEVPRRGFLLPYSGRSG